MKNALIPFVFERHEVRIVLDDGVEYWVGKDVALALGYKNPNDAMNDHCRGVAKRYPIVDTLGRTQEVRILSEGDVLRLISHCNLPEGERFESWIYDVVLPQIRKTGSYVSGNAAFDPRLVHELNETLNDTKRTLMAFQSENRHLRKENMLHEKIERLTDALGKKGTRVTDVEKEAIMLRSGVLPVAQIADLTGRSEKTVRAVIAANRGHIGGVA